MRTFIHLFLVCCCLAAQVVAPAATAGSLKVDLLILHGKVVDGSGAKPCLADVGIQGDRIVFIGNAAKANVTAARIIDATGLVVAPGFIDSHTHTMEDLSDPQRNLNENYLMQGVTTVVTGNDGASAVSIRTTLDKWERQGIGTNAALLAGHGTIRGQVLGQSNAQPSPDFGYFADVIVFDERTVSDRSTYEQPEVLSVGMHYVIVNGKVAVDEGKPTGILAGRPLRKPVARQANRQ